MRSSDDTRRPHLPIPHRLLVFRSLATGTALAIGVSAASAGVARALPPRPNAARAESRAEHVGARELLVVDARVPHRELFVAAARRGVEALLLDGGRDGLAQIEAAVRGRTFVAIHLVAHGRPGEIHVGSTVLDARGVARHREALGRWFPPRAPLEPRPELLVYACDAVSGPAGASLIAALADATGAEVAGSIDRTGSPALGADWNLEASTGPIEAALPIAWSAARAYPATLEVFQVTSNAASGAGSLAQAVADANANANPDEIDVIRFASVTGAIAPGATLSITEPLSIVGPGADVLTIDGSDAGRVFDVSSTLAVEGLAVANGMALEGGGGAFRVNGGTLDVEQCLLSGNGAAESGGAIAAYDASVVVTETMLHANTAALGGAIFTSASSLDVVASAFERNTASSGGGAIAIDSSTVFIDDSLLAENEAGGAGGGIHAEQATLGPPLVSVQNSTISGNTAASGGGLAAVDGSYVELVHVTVAENAITGAASGCSGAGVDGCGLAGSGLVIVESSIVAGNRAGSAPSVDLAGDALDLELEVRASLVGVLEGGVATSGDPIFAEDPLLGPLADNGGATRTHALLAGSPAIDRGENPGALAFDQRGVGFPRVVGEAADMGAYEWSPDDGSGGGGGGGLDGGAGDGGVPIEPKGSGGSDGCGCSVPGAGSEGASKGGGLLAALVAFGSWRRRRRPR